MKEANREQLSQFQVNDEDYNNQLKEMEEKIKKEQVEKERELEEARRTLDE